MWFQGCSLACSGCVARDTWAHDAGAVVAVADVVTCIVETLVAHGLDGVTISGGEPFEQPDALAALVGGVRAATAERTPEVDILVYSGLSEARVRRLYPLVLDDVDALIPEPYAEARPSAHAWWGSGNQRLVALSDLGRRRYADPPRSEEAAMQLSVEDGRLWVIGVPRRGDLEKVADRAASAGVQLRGVSWRP